MALGAYYFDIDISSKSDQVEPSTEADYSLVFPADRYPETGAHIQDAIRSGHSAICTIDRSGAEDNRSESLKGVPTKKGFDRDEWPMAMCAEGGANADIEYISPKDNRGAGSWVGNQLEDYSDGSRVEFIFQ
ncbi:NucA/NucB deoxyribonuclease domain-containing protein [Paenibacillus glacialis]|nr:NucA/NucB deoxyribonuclease domain-containing protein [Paenibacillus glacialis]